MTNETGANASTTFTNAVVFDGDPTFGWVNNGPTFTGPITLMRDCTLIASTWVTLGVGPAISGHHALRFTGTGAAGIHRDNTGWSGSVILDGDVELGHLMGLGFAGPTILTGNRTLTMNRDSTFSGSWSSVARHTLTRTGAARLILSGNNSAYTGDGHTAGGPLRFAATNALGQGRVSMATNSTVELDVNANWRLPNDLIGFGTLFERTCIC